jgi:DNA-binding NarL/FixJ family response regulator
MNVIRVLLVDDHAMVRAGLRALLDAAQDIKVIGEAENGRQAVQEAKRLRPDVVLLDVAMPLLNGVEAARQIATRVPTAKVLILSSYNDVNHLRQALEAGVDGYLTKESAANDLLEAIRAAYQGGAFFSPALLPYLLKERWRTPRDNTTPPNKTVALSVREAEVLQLIAEGFANKQAAGLLGLSIKTVEKHRQSLMAKLSIHKTASLTSYAIFNGVIESTRPPISPLRPALTEPQLSKTKFARM